MQETCVKYEEWGNGFVLLLISLIVLWLLLGVWFLVRSNIVFAVIFAGLFVSVLFSALYLTCRHCYYYGKKCYLAMGLVVPSFFEKVEGAVAPWRASLWFVHMFLAIAFPLVFIFRENSLAQAALYSIAYLAAPVTAIVLVSRFGCPRCRHTSCLSNPDRKKAGAAPAR